MKMGNVRIKLIDWRKFLIKEVSQMLEKGIVLDIGGNTPYHKELSVLPKQHQAKYFSLDYIFKVNPHIVGDAHRLPIKDEHIDSVILKSVLEHVQNPYMVIAEAKRVLKPKGKLLLWVPFLHSYHASSSYKDYYRFTQDGVEELLKDFFSVQIIPDRAYFEVLSELLPMVLGKLIRKPAKLLDRLIKVKAQYVGFGALAVK